MEIIEYNWVSAKLFQVPVSCTVTYNSIALISRIINSLLLYFTLEWNMTVFASDWSNVAKMMECIFEW